MIRCDALSLGVCRFQHAHSAGPCSGTLRWGERKKHARTQQVLLTEPTISERVKETRTD